MPIFAIMMKTTREMQLRKGYGMKIYERDVEDAAGRELFAQLLDKCEHQEWDDEYLRLLIEYQKLYPASEKFEVFYARYALAYGNVRLALETAHEGERKRRVSPVLWEILAECYERLDQPYEAALYRTYLRVHCRQPLRAAIPEGEFGRYMDLFTCAARAGVCAPYIARATMAEGALKWDYGVYAGEHISNVRPEAYPYWVGAYLECGELDSYGWLLAQHRADPDYVDNAGADFVYDLWRSTVQTELAVPCAAGERYILPLAGTVPGQTFDFSLGGQNFVDYGGRYRYLFYRIEQPVHIRSDQPFAAVRPIRLGHSPQRKKLVLNILVDALSWGAVKEYDYADVPNLMRFFSKGIIFNNHFSAAEYTYPSLASIETGMYLHHNQTFNELFGQEIDPAYITISERMAALGYLCINVMSMGEGVYNGATRGHERIIVNLSHALGYECVERTIRHIEAFDECDQFLWLHFADPHAYTPRGQAAPMSAQTHVPLMERLAAGGDAETSVHLPRRPVYVAANRQGIRNADRALGALFDYLEAHFSDDEYIVHLYSDHGVSIYEPEPYLTSETQAGAALMIRGADVPALGIVEELTSGVDIYNIMAHTVGFPVGENVDGNLPAALGGEERAYVISNSIYPGKPYELGIRTQDYEFRLRSAHPVSMDGTTDLTGAQMWVWTRPAHEPVEDERIFAYFRRIARDFTRGTIDNAGHCWTESMA